MSITLKTASYPDVSPLENQWARKGGRERESGRDSPRLFFLPVVHRAARSSRETPEGEADTEELIFKMAAARFLDVSPGETKKMKKNAIALIIE